MKRYYLFIFLLTQSLLFPLQFTSAFPHAEKNAKAHNLPLVLLFVGSDWSEESRQLTGMLHSPQVNEVLKNSMVGCVVDFPEINTQSKATLRVNAELKKRFGITQLPALVLLDENQEYVTTVGYVPVPPQVFASHIKELLDTYRGITTALGNSSALSPKELIGLLSKAKQLQNESLIEQIVDEGRRKSDDTLFAIEKYAIVKASPEGDPKLLEKLKHEIEKKASSSSVETKLQTGLLAFETMKSRVGIEQALSSFEKVLQEVPSSTKNLWRVQYRLAECLLEAKKRGEARAYAEKAREKAPEAFHKALDQIIAGD